MQENDKLINRSMCLVYLHHFEAVRICFRPCTYSGNPCLRIMLKVVALVEGVRRDSIWKEVICHATVSRFIEVSHRQAPHPSSLCFLCKICCILCSTTSVFQWPKPATMVPSISLTAIYPNLEPIAITNNCSPLLHKTEEVK